MLFAECGGKVLARRKTAVEGNVGDALFRMTDELPGGGFESQVVEVLNGAEVGGLTAVVDKPGYTQSTALRHGLQGVHPSGLLRALGPD